MIVPSFAFPSLPNAVALRGAVPVFVDIRADTLNLDERARRGRDHAERPGRSPRSTTPGSARSWTRSSRSPERHGLVVIEDAAQGYRRLYRERPLGTRPTSAASASTRRRT